MRHTSSELCLWAVGLLRKHSSGLRKHSDKQRWTIVLLHRFAKFCNYSTNTFWAAWARAISIAGGQGATDINRPFPGTCHRNFDDIFPDTCTHHGKRSACMEYHRVISSICPCRNPLRSTQFRNAMLCSRAPSRLRHPRRSTHWCSSRWGTPHRDSTYAGRVETWNVSGI